eukprot:TRINITY_DN38595_c0_g1_i1.p1 TRINITY_DN38595_c0_g1~~TRINITY_DN38595_c0_g1_i1.p1  ORF type:complete len:321 (+),score=60.43 TRINITY_DN38595_c0_g1_i1:78-965(+)
MLAAGSIVTLKQFEAVVSAVPKFPRTAEASVGALHTVVPRTAGATTALPLSFLGAASVVRAAASSSRIFRRAEPVSTAAAAAVAAKAAAAAKGAKATASAVVSSAGMETLTKGGVPGSQASKEQVRNTDTLIWRSSDRPDFDPTVQVGAMVPLGYFDPASFCEKGDESRFHHFRAAEIKHGRVAMMAALGALAQHYVKFPGFESVPSGLAAATSYPGSYGFICLFAVVGVLEVFVWTESSTKEPGNYGDPLGLNQYTEDMRAKELNNGRFAMFATMGIIVAELVTGKDAIEQLGF